MPISLIPDSHITFYISSAAMMQSAEKTGLEPVRRRYRLMVVFETTALPF